MRPFLPTAVALGLAIGFSSTLPSQDDAAAFDDALQELTTAMRSMIEPQFEASVGFGFSSFECPVQSMLGPGAVFDCIAVDEEGDTIRYTLAVDDEGTASVVLASQPAAELSDGDRSVLESPCRRFFELYGSRDWSSLIAELHLSLVETVGGDGIRAQLEPIRSSLGELGAVELETYGRHTSGRHELEYALACANGPGIARIGLLPDDEGLRVAAFTVRPAPGSDLHTELLSEESRAMASELIGEEVDRMDVAFDRLDHVGAAVEGTAWLADGRGIAIRAVQDGRADDFDVIDYKIQMLDVPLMIRRALASRPDPAETVDCPSPIAPDGGSMTCRVRLASDTLYSATVARQGGEHRILAFEPLK